MVVVSSFSELFGFFNLEHPWTISHWRDVLQSPAFVNALTQSVLIGTVVAVVGTLLYLALAWLLVRHSFRGKSAMSLAIWLPWAIPGVLLGSAFLTVFLNVPGLRLAYGTAVALLLLLFVPSLSFVPHLFEAAIFQISSGLAGPSLIHRA